MSEKLEQFKCPKCQTVITPPAKVYAHDLKGNILDVKLRVVEYDCPNPGCEWYHRTTIEPKRKSKK